MVSPPQRTARRRPGILLDFLDGTLLLIVTSIAGLLFGTDAVRGGLPAELRSLLGEAGSKAVEAMLGRCQLRTFGTASGNCGPDPAPGHRSWSGRPGQGCHEHDLERRGPKGSGLLVVLTHPPDLVRRDPRVGVSVGHLACHQHRLGRAFILGWAGF